MPTVNTRRGCRGPEGGCPLGAPPRPGMSAYLLQGRAQEAKDGQLHDYGSSETLADDDPRPGTADHTFPLISSTFPSTNKSITRTLTPNTETN